MCRFGHSDAELLDLFLDSIFLVVFVALWVWGTFPCYLLHFGAKIHLLRVICSVLKPTGSMILSGFSMVLLIFSMVFTVFPLRTCITEFSIVLIYCSTVFIEFSMDAFGASPFWLPVSIHQDDQQTSGWIPGEFQGSEVQSKDEAFNFFHSQGSWVPFSFFKGWDHQAMMYITYVYIYQCMAIINSLYKIYYDIWYIYILLYITYPYSEINRRYLGSSLMN